MSEHLPLEQLIAHRKQSCQLSFSALAMEVMPESDDLLVEPSRHGLRLHGANETALELPREILQDRFGDQLRVMPLGIKLQQHGTLIYEPIMFVRTEANVRHQLVVRGELRARGVTILEEDVRRRLVITRALGALRRLLGFPQAFHKAAGDRGYLWIWLSHYAPIDPEDGARAA